MECNSSCVIKILCHVSLWLSALSWRYSSESGTRFRVPFRGKHPQNRTYYSQNWAQLSWRKDHYRVLGPPKSASSVPTIKVTLGRRNELNKFYETHSQAFTPVPYQLNLGFRGYTTCSLDSWTRSSSDSLKSNQGSYFTLSWEGKRMDPVDSMETHGRSWICMEWNSYRKGKDSVPLPLFGNRVGTKREQNMGIILIEPHHHSHHNIWVPRLWSSRKKREGGKKSSIQS